jgi:hypothetical protein
VKGSILHLLALVAPVALLAACGDGGGTTSSNTGGSAGSGAAGGSTASNGGGGSGTAGSAGSTAPNGGGGSGGSTTTTTTTSDGGSTSTGAMGACTNMADGMKLQEAGDTLQDTIAKCAQDNFIQEPGTLDCIKMETGLSAECSQCFDDTVHCAFENCFAQCSGDPGSQECADCRAQFCDPAFKTCSGLDPAQN